MRKKQIIQHNTNNLRLFKEATNSPGYLYYIHYIDKHKLFRKDIFSVCIFDRLDNEGMNSLIKSIYKLTKDSRFAVSNYFIKPKRSNINYVSRNLVGQTSFSVAEIKTQESEWINSISIGATYITNSDVLVETRFYLRKCINSYKRMHDFLQAYQMKCDKYVFYDLYYKMENLDNDTLLKQEEMLFYDVFQDIVCRYLYSDLGKTYALPMCVDCRIIKYNALKERMLRKMVFAKVYHQDNDFLVKWGLRGRVYYFYLHGGKNYKENRLLSLFSTYTTEMYYRSFRDIEINELEKRIRKYLNSRRKRVAAKDIKWLINKRRGIEEHKERLSYELNESSLRIENWKVYKGNSWEKERIISDDSASNSFSTMYRQNLEYLQALGSTSDNKTILFVTIATLVISVISVIITILK